MVSKCKLVACPHPDGLSDPMMRKPVRDSVASAHAAAHTPSLSCAFCNFYIPVIDSLRLLATASPPVSFLEQALSLTKG